ncbi:MAG: hypothetical protein MJY54_01605 [archaeon]|nr:hypothetical protein [archaeon]
MLSLTYHNGCEKLTFCVNCNVEDKNIIDGLCVDCFLEGKKIVELPHHVDLLKCVNCGDYLIGSQWIEGVESEVIVNIVLSTIKLISTAKIIEIKPIIEKQDERTFLTTIQTAIDIRGSIRSDKSSTIVRLKNSVCKKCSRQLGNYYEAIIQIRPGKRKSCKDLCSETITWIKNMVEIRAKTNQQLFISKIQNVPGGINVYLSSTSLSKSLAHKIANMYNTEMKESASLIGSTSDGREIHRTTFLVRIPSYRVGDIVFHNDHVCKLNSIGRNGIQATDLSNFRHFFIKKSATPSIKVIAETEEIAEATVVHVSNDEIQILHPRDYSTQDIRIPPNSRIGERVKVIEVKGELFYIP